MKNILFLFSISLIVINNFGCSPVGVLGSGAATTMVVAEGERSLGTVVDDATIKINIGTKFLSSDDNLFVNVDSTVLEGKVLLTGLVENQEIRIDAVRRVWEIEGVKEVINEIEIGNRETLKEYGQDVWINTQAKALSIKTIGLSALSLNFETIKGKVYIAGISSRPELIEEAIKAIKTIKGVKEIVNYVTIKE
tara:strand:- start:2676 stop:3257 length:582 start_codon:yes stop_codon:yes gene_type:complete